MTVEADAMIRLRQAEAAVRRGELDAGREAYLELLASLTEKHPRLVDVLCGLANIAQRLNRFMRAEDYLQRALQVLTDEGDRVRMAQLHDQLGLLRRKQGELRRARDHYEASLELRDGLDDELGVAVSLSQLSQVYRYLGKDAEANRCLERELSIRHRAGDDAGAAHAASELLRDASARGRWDRAARFAAAQVEARRKLGAGPGLASALTAMGRLYLRAERPEEARLAFEEALTVLSAAAATAPHLDILHGLATSLVRLIEQRPEFVQRAALLCQEALTEAESRVDKATEGKVRRLQGVLQRHQGQLNDALLSLQRARDLLKRAPGNNAEDACLAALELASLVAETDPADARSFLREADEILHRGSFRGEELKVCQLALRLAKLAVLLGDEGLARKCHTRSEACLKLAEVSLSSAGEPWSQQLADLEEELQRLGRSLGEEGPEPVPIQGLDAILSQFKGEQARRKLAAEVHSLRQLAEIGRALNAEETPKGVLERVVGVMLECSEAERAYVVTTGDRGLPPRAAAGDVAERGVDVRAAVGREGPMVLDKLPPLPETLIRQVAASGKPFLTMDASDHDESEPEGAADLRSGSVLCLPFVSRGRVVGAVHLEHAERNRFQSVDMRLLLSLIDFAGLALERVWLGGEDPSGEGLAERNVELEQVVRWQKSEIARVKSEARQSQAQLERRYHKSRLVGHSQVMRNLFRILDRVTESDIPVLLIGESGTGKELVGRAIHFNGPRAEEPFVVQSCGAIPETLLESALFGHVKGAFTGAAADRLGLFGQAGRGTLFLDAVDDMAPKMQKLLLRVLTDAEFRPVGSSESRPFEARVISALGRDLREAVREGRFREDLYYRLNAFTVTIPSLAERREDIPALVEVLLSEIAPDRRVRMRKGAMQVLMQHTWPGNVRELRNVLEKAVLLSGKDEIAAEDLELESHALRREDFYSLTYSEAKNAFARSYLERLLVRNGGNVTRAAKESGMLRQAFQRLLKRYELKSEHYKS